MRCSRQRQHRASIQDLMTAAALWCSWVSESASCDGRGLSKGSSWGVSQQYKALKLMKADRRKENWEIFPHLLWRQVQLSGSQTSCVCVFAQGQFNSNSRTNKWSLEPLHRPVHSPSLNYVCKIVYVNPVHISVVGLKYKKIPKKKLILLLSFVLHTLDHFKYIFFSDWHLCYLFVQWCYNAVLYGRLL